MDALTPKVHAAIEAVARLREQQAADPLLAQAAAAVKRFQGLRFAATYADLMHQTRYRAATRFFLDELYGDRDYAERDQQFVRIASTVHHVFPPAVVKTAGTLAEVHMLTEQLDDRMARHWRADALAVSRADASTRYIRCWRQVADRAARQHQLAAVLELGGDLDRLTRTRGLLMMLKLMRRPAAAAGLSALQHFLESGFGAFACMRGADVFLQTVQARESHWIACLFNEDTVACETQLTHLLAAGSPIEPGSARH